METAEEIKKKIDNTSEDFQQLRSRWDEIWQLWSLKKNEGNYDIMTKAFQGQRETEVDFVSPAPRSYVDLVHSRLCNSERQIIIRLLEKEGEDKRDELSKLERLIAFAFDKADDKLIFQGEGPLLDFLIFTALLRGRMCVRTMVYELNGEIVFDLKPWDPYNVKYERGARGYSWITNTTYRSAEAIKDEYGKDVPKEKYNEVIDYWKDTGDVIENSVICGSEKLHEDSYKLDNFNVLYIPVPGVPAISTSQGITVFHGDSILGPPMEIFKFENELISMWASHAKLLYKQPTINYLDEDGQELSSTVFLNEAVINLPMGHNKLDASPVKEISPTLVNLTGLISSLRQRATLPDIEYGELRNFPLSGTAINELQQARDKVFGPILRALNILYTQICYQIEQQLISNNIQVDVKTEIKQKFYQAKVKPKELKAPHLIRVEFTARTPWTQLETYQIAQMAKQMGLPDAFIWEFIIKIPDPKATADMAAVEIAEHSPALLRLRAIATLLDQGRHDEARSLIDELYNEWQQEQQGQQQREVPNA